MLDDVKHIKRIDKSRMLDILSDYSKHVTHAVKLCKDISIPRKISNVVVTGMGGSAVGGDILRYWSKNKLSLPVIVNRDYTLPKFVDLTTLVFAVSYSGNTEETLSAFEQAVDRKCNIIGITSGGVLQRICEDNDVQLIKIPEGLQPRCAVCYMTIPLICIIGKSYLQALDIEIDDTITSLAMAIDNCDISTPISENIAKQIATQIKDSYPIIYGHTYYSPICRRWRTQFNENAKILARDDIFPEMNHNDIVGWINNDYRNDRYAIILLRDERESECIKTRIELTKELVFSNVTNLIEVWSKGKTVLGKMFYTMCIGDYVSVYLAILRGIDPTPVEIIEKFKAKLCEKKN